MTDNFKEYKEFIKWHSKNTFPQHNKAHNRDMFYTIELMRRGKDNPNTPAANIHFKNYYIYCYDDLDKYEADIKELCKVMRMRAYCSINYKLLSKVALMCISDMTKRIMDGDLKKFNTIFESCCGRYKNRKDRLWVVDIDDVTISDPILNMYEEVVRESTNKPFINDDIKRVVTRSGVHLITSPFNREKFNEALLNKGINKEDIPEVKMNHLTLLYEDL